MSTILANTSVSPLRQKLIDDMTKRHFLVATQPKPLAQSRPLAHRRLMDKGFAASGERTSGRSQNSVRST